MKTNELIMMVGLPGSGKSTYVNRKYNDGYTILSSDVLIERVADARGLNYSDVFNWAISAATRHFESSIELDSISLNDIVIDRTNLSYKSRKRLLNKLHNPDKYKKIAIVMDIHKDEILRRLSERNTSGKYISEELLEEMLSRYEFPTKEEGFDEVITLHWGV